MKKLYSSIFAFLVLSVLCNPISAQKTVLDGQLHGTFQLDAQAYSSDSLIGAQAPPEKMGLNSFLDLVYTYGDFEAGVRFEAFLPPLQGFDPRYKGMGLPYRYAKYSKDNFEFTLGNFYEQFGSGLILRSYQEWNLGFDNSIDGVRVKYKNKGVVVKALAGKQRLYWSKSDGIVRGIDVDFSLNEIFKSLENKKTKVFFGGSFVSKYEADLDPIYVLPENVCAFSGRLSLSRGDFNFKAEGAYKINDPNASNNFIYKDGNGLVLEAGYSKKGLGILLQAKRTDNLDFRSARSATGFDSPIGYISAMTRQHIFLLPSMYPYATQANGEMGLQSTVIYTFKKGSFLGGKNGANISLNYSVATNINRKKINDSTDIGKPGTYGYASDFFKLGKELYYGDFNVVLAKKLTQKLKISAEYVSLFFNINVIQGHAEPNVRANIGIVDVNYNLKPKHNLHVSGEAMFTKQDKGNWAAGLIEYKYKSYFIALIDQYNYGNPSKDLQIHYFSASAGFTKGTTRFSMQYGKQREGVLCVGGVCRQVPAANGFSIAISGTF